MKLKIKNNTGFSNDTEITVDDEPLAGVMSIEFKPIVQDSYIITHLKIESNFLDIETDKFTLEVIDITREKCEWDITSKEISTGCGSKFGKEFDIQQIIFCPNCGLKIKGNRNAIIWSNNFETSVPSTNLGNTFTHLVNPVIGAVSFSADDLKI